MANWDLPGSIIMPNHGWPWWIMGLYNWVMKPQKLIMAIHRSIRMWMIYNRELSTLFNKWKCFITVTSQWARRRLKSPTHDCLLNRLFRHRPKKTSNLRVTGQCEGNSPVTGEFWVSSAEMIPFDDVIMLCTHPSCSAPDIKGVCVTNMDWI